jgi:hypothetical protein
MDGLLRIRRGETMAKADTPTTEQKREVVRVFGKVEVTSWGLRVWFTSNYAWSISADRLGTRVACHLQDSKRAEVRGPMADIEAALAFAREYHGVPSEGWPCYCGGGHGTNG